MSGSQLDPLPQADIKGIAGLDASDKTMVLDDTPDVSGDGYKIISQTTTEPGAEAAAGVLSKADGVYLLGLLKYLQNTFSPSLSNRSSFRPGILSRRGKKAPGLQSSNQPQPGPSLTNTELKALLAIKARSPSAAMDMLKLFNKHPIFKTFAKRLGDQKRIMELQRRPGINLMMRPAPAVTTKVELVRGEQAKNLERAARFEEPSVEDTAAVALNPEAILGVVRNDRRTPRQAGHYAQLNATLSDQLKAHRPEPKGRKPKDYEYAPAV